ncbi:cdc42 effector protein 1 [Corythoichthys intestinalis]|uniref:cdc42 effector protein 1 n=1 Tax=Corythoichthys intestinalis TaxID=161448 RepID=UPI0025A57176|nr:cdc42 effector protein 1 [Corythoichthys intestinalis]XP_061807818.1 cdc42 effector protein 1-like [Nerophis lumbriciformis]
MNLQEKLSGLKGLVTHSHGKRRVKADLTADMISPPLGDFRHTMHVGRGGEVFGDTSFLSNHGGSANGGNGETDSVSGTDNKLGAFFSRTLRQIRRGSDHRSRAGSKDMSFPPPAVSPIIKNAISLPRLDVDMYNGTPSKMLFPSSQSTPAERTSSYGLESGFVTLPRLSRSERQQSYSANVHRGSLTGPADAVPTARSAAVVTSSPESTAFSSSFASLTSLDTFNLDLGPSLMSEVFGLLDGDGHAWEGDETGPANEGSEMDSATISYVDSLLREDVKSPQGAEWDDDQGSVNKVEMSGKPQGGKLAVRMESERFQSAADVLARHYGGHNKMEAGNSRNVKKISYSYMADDDDDDEIKV